MFTICVDKECGCFKRSSFENNMNFSSKDDALIQAKLMVEHMNTKFCKKHGFELSEDGANFNITVNMNSKPAHSGCCGGGHCS